MSVKCELYNDNFQNWKSYNIQKAQLVIADIPYNVGTDAFGSSPLWWKDGDRRNGESEKAGKAFFHTDPSQCPPVAFTTACTLSLFLYNLSAANAVSQSVT